MPACPCGGFYGVHRKTCGLYIPPGRTVVPAMLTLPPLDHKRIFEAIAAAVTIIDGRTTQISVQDFLDCIAREEARRTPDARVTATEESKSES